MSVSSPIFESHYDYKMDPKYRVSIPVEWRPGSEEVPVRLQLSKEHDLAVVKVFTEEEFNAKFEVIEASALTREKKIAIVGHLRMMSKQVTISGQGKLTVPKDWSERVGLKADGPVVLAGRGSYYMLCPQETFQKICEIEFDMGDGELGVL